MKECATVEIRMYGELTKAIRNSLGQEQWYSSLGMIVDYPNFNVCDMEWPPGRYPDEDPWTDVLIEDEVT